MSIGVNNSSLVGKDTSLDSQDLKLGWDGISFTAKIIDGNSVDHDFNLLRNTSSDNTVYGFGFDEGGLFAIVDGSRIYITTK